MSVGPGADDRLRTVRLPAAVGPSQGAHIRVLRHVGGDTRGGGAGLGVVRRGRRGRARVTLVGTRGRRRCGRRRGSGPLPVWRGGLRLPGRGDAFQGFAGRGLYDLRFRPAARLRHGGSGRGGRRAGGGGPLDRHTAGEGGDRHGDQERRGRRRSMHPGNSAGSQRLWGAGRRRLPRTSDPSAPPAGVGRGGLTAEEVMSRGATVTASQVRRGRSRSVGRRPGGVARAVRDRDERVPPNCPTQGGDRCRPRRTCAFPAPRGRHRRRTPDAAAVCFRRSTVSGPALGRSRRDRCAWTGPDERRRSL